MLYNAVTDQQLEADLIKGLMVEEESPTNEEKLAALSPQKKAIGALADVDTWSQVGYLGFFKSGTFG